MKVEEAKLPPELEEFIRSKGITDFYPPQDEALKAGLLEGRSLVISSPTASGKTLIAMMAAYVKAKVSRRKSVYLAPLRALASEKYAEFSELQKYGITTAISTGDYDSTGENLGRADIIVLTNERFDSV
ncbi:MAG TPA: DEAD/DEAH box helicase, partial [Nitrososphaerales archaeon]|nr:DEAD/DEAH box helicase [Nitrososphaerales archaeon]